MAMPIRSPLSLAVFGLLALGDAAAQTVTVSPSVSTSLTVTDNAGASRAGGFGGSSGGKGESDLIFEVAPAISVQRDGGRVSGTFGARLRNVLYANDSGRNTSFVALNGAGRIEAVEDLFFVDADASVSRTDRSAFANRTSGDSLDVSKNNETRVWSLAPRAEFRLGGDTRGTVRYQSRWLSSAQGQIAGQHVGTLAARLSNPVASSLLGWEVDYSRSDTKYDDEGGTSLRKTDRSAQIGRATLFLRATPELRLRAIAGRESNDYGGLGRESGSIAGGGVDWTPSERTSVSATAERRMFGTGYDASVRHRMVRTTVFMTASRDMQSSLDRLAGGGLVDPLYLSLYDNPDLVRLFPDPFVRREVALELLRQLRGDVLTNSYFVERSWRGGISHSLLRGMLTLTLNRSERTRMGEGADLGEEDDFRNFDDIKTSSVTLSYSHQLTPSASLNVSLGRSDSEGRGDSRGDTERTTFVVGVSSSLGPQTAGSLQYRHQRSDTNGVGSNDFTENAVIATVNMRF